MEDSIQGEGKGKACGMEQVVSVLVEDQHSRLTELHFEEDIQDTAL